MIHCSEFYASPFISKARYFELSFHIPLDFEIAGFDCNFRGWLHDTGATFAPERVRSGSLSWLYICLHDTTTNFMLARVTPVLVPRRKFHSCTKSRNGIMKTRNDHPFRGEIGLPVDGNGKRMRNVRD